MSNAICPAVGRSSEDLVAALLAGKVGWPIIQAEVCLSAEAGAARLIVFRPDDYSIAADLVELRNRFGPHATRPPYLRRLTVRYEGKLVMLELNGARPLEVVYWASNLDPLEQAAFEKSVTEGFEVNVVARRAPFVCGTEA